jgi:predicted DsbA family dithiol-disulfide isomerase
MQSQTGGSRLNEIEIYSSLECPYAYLAAYRLKQLRPVYAGRIRLVWRALSLETINKQSYPKPLFEAEYGLFRVIEPDLPWQPWARPDWQWPSTYLPAFEALACAQVQGEEEAFQMSWALRHAYFAESRNLSLRHELLDIAAEVAANGGLDLGRFVSDWDSGRCKSQVLEESERGWRGLKLEGSATFVLPDGSRHTNPAVGEIDFDEEHFLLRSYQPFEGDPLAAYSLLMDAAALTC